MQFKLAWRNLWRNRRRTFITMASVLMAVVLCSLVMSMKEGTYARMIDSSIGNYMGYVRVNAKGFWENKSIDDAVSIPDSIQQDILSQKHVTGIVPRLESGAMASVDDITRVTMVVGFDPEKEHGFSGLADRVIDGHYPQAGEKKLLIGSGLADYLKVGVGDTLVLLGQGYHAANAAGKYDIGGIVKFGDPNLSKRMVFLPLKEAQWMYDAIDMNTSGIVQVDNPKKAQTIAAGLTATLDTAVYEVMPWQDLNPELVNMIETDRVEGYVLMFILYMVVGFGVFGTMLMMLAERRREFGMLVGLGMKRMKLSLVLWIELSVISILGSLAGVILAIPVCGYFYYFPIKFGQDMQAMVEDYGMEAVLQTSLDPSIFIKQGIIVLILASVISIYPFVKLLGLNAIKSMRA